MSSKWALIVFVILISAELVLWKGLSPRSWNRALDPVQRHDLVIEPATVSLGSLSLGEERTLSITVTNRKGRAIELQKPNASCDCIRLTQSKSVIGPGESAEFKLNFIAPDTPGDVRKNISIRVASAASKWRIPIVGTVVAESWARPPRQNMVVDELGATAKGTVRFSPDNPVTHVVCSHPEAFAVELGPSSPAARSYEVSIQPDITEHGKGYAAFLDGNGNKLADVDITWRPKSLIDCHPKRLSWNNATRNERRKIVVLSDAEPVSQLRVEPAVPWVKVEDREEPSENLLRFHVSTRQNRMPDEFDGTILRVVDARSGQSTSVKGSF